MTNISVGGGTYGKATGRRYGELLRVPSFSDCSAIPYFSRLSNNACTPLADRQIFIFGNLTSYMSFVHVIRTHI